MSVVDAKRYARNIFQQTSQVIPVDIEAIAEHYGVDIRRQDLEEEVSGMLVIKDNRSVIGVNKSHHPHRQRFTVAHEMGHYLLHRNETRVFIDASTVFFRDERSSEGTRIQEIEANAFAAELLMPTHALKERIGNQILDELDDIEIRRLADQFSVSIQSLSIRLVRLGLIQG